MAAAQTNELIKTLISTVEKLREEQAISTLQVSELHAMMTSLSTLSAKLDILDQKTTEVASVKPAPKKRVAKKVDEVEAEPETAEPKALPKKRVSKKAAAAAADVEPEAAAESDTEAPPPKPRAKKTVKPVAVKAKPARDITIIQYFNQEYAKDPNTFNSFLPREVKNSIHEANKEELNELTGAELAKKKQALYYHYVKDNHNPGLQSMKRAYIEAEKAKRIQLLETDDAEASS